MHSIGKKRILNIPDPKLGPFLSYHTYTYGSFRGRGYQNPLISSDYRPTLQVMASGFERDLDQRSGVEGLRVSGFGFRAWGQGFRI